MISDNLGVNLVSRVKGYLAFYVPGCAATAQSAQPQAQQQQSQQQKRAAKPSASTASQGSRKREKKRGNSSKGAEDTAGCCPLCKDPSLGLMYLCPMCLKVGGCSILLSINCKVH